MTKNYVRKRDQLLILNSDKEIQVGKKEDLPLSIEELEEINQESPWVEEISKGLTAIVYKIKVDGQYYALKKKRKKTLARNIDAQLAFLNEIQRRRDFEKLKKTVPQLYNRIAETIFASLKHGFILSPWIKGECITLQNSRDIYENLFDTFYLMECNGFFEWDICSNNLLLVDNNQVMLFDFGCTYLYNPLYEYNSAGKKEPIFHGVERFETRMLMTYFLINKNIMTEDMILCEYRTEKETALKYYIRKLRWLEEHRADDDIINWIKEIMERWEWGLRNSDNLELLYRLESFRSYVLDVNNDINGKYCNFMSRKKLDQILKKLSSDYDLLKQNNGFFWGDELLSKEKLIEKYSRKKVLIEKYRNR